MDTRENANMLIKTINVWQFLQYFDDLVERDDDRSTSILHDFFIRHYNLSLDHLKTSGILPLAQLTTTLSLLLSTLCFARWRIEDSSWEEGMKKPVDYDMHCEGPENPRIAQVIRTMRNAAVHGFDDSDYISFPEEKIVSFQTKHRGFSRVTFCTAIGFVSFIQDYIRVIKKETVKQMQS